MKQYADLLPKMLEGATLASHYKMPIRHISVSAMADIMGVPEVAVRAIGRSAGIDQSEWIDEDSLGVFEEAYIRKLKAYFKRMVHNAVGLGSTDLCTFIEFCKTFKKPSIDYKKICNWNDIDEYAIREQFIREVKSSLTFIEDSSELFTSNVHISLTERVFDVIIDRQPFEQFEFETKCFDRQRNVLRKVTSSFAYRTISVPLIIHTRNRQHLPHFYVAAHYHIYCREDKGDHHEDTVENIGRSDRLINSTLMMVA